MARKGTDGVKHNRKNNKKEKEKKVGPYTTKYARIKEEMEANRKEKSKLENKQ
jgi:hypothetical protein